MFSDERQCTRCNLVEGTYLSSLGFASIIPRFLCGSGRRASQLYWFFKGCATTSTHNDLGDILRLVMRPEFLVSYPTQDSMSCTYKAGARPRFSDASLAYPVKKASYQSMGANAAV